VLLGSEEPVVSDHRDEPAAVPDIISGGGEDFSAFAVARWPWLVRLGQRIRPGRTRTLATCLGLAAIVAATALVAARGGAQRSPTPATSAPASAAGPGGVFATGTVDGHPWRLAVRDIADPGQRCLPGVTINDTDADPVYPNPDSSASVTLGTVYPGFSFGFIQVPAQVGMLVIDGSSVRAVTATACGDHYRLIGFSYPLNGASRIIAVERGASMSTSFFPVPVPVVSDVPSGSFPQDVGLWDNVGALAPAASATIGSGTVSGGRWFMWLQVGLAGDCYEFEGTSSLGSAQMGACGPIGAPGAAATIMALPLDLPDGNSATGYAVELSPDTARLEATLSDGASEPAYPRIVAGRKYAAFTVGGSARVTRLAWLRGNGAVLASTTAIPRYGYLQFQP
jgi:hypothetical protein